MTILTSRRRARARRLAKMLQRAPSGTLNHRGWQRALRGYARRYYLRQCGGARPSMAMVKLRDIR